MDRAEKITRLENEIDRLKNELKCLKHNTFDIKEKLIYPQVSKEGVIESRTFALTDSFGRIVRTVLTPEYRREGNFIGTYSKNIRELSDYEYRMVSDCINECFDVVRKYAKEMYPEGIAWGETYKGSFYKEKKDDKETEKESCTQ